MHLARLRIPQQRGAEAAGVSQASFSRRLSGTTPFSVDEVYAIADLLEMPPVSLLPRPERCSA